MRGWLRWVSGLVRRSRPRRGLTGVFAQPAVVRWRIRVTEVDENSLRNLMTRMREDDPGTFIRILLDTLLAKIEPDSIVAINRKAFSDETDSVILVFTGENPSRWAEQSIAELQQKLATWKRERNED